MAMTRRINVDLQLIVTAAILSLYGLAVVFSAGHTDVRTVATNAYRAQAVWLVVAIIAAFAVSRASVRLIEWMTVPAYAFTIVCSQRSSSDLAPAAERRAARRAGSPSPDTDSASQRSLRS